MALPTTTISMSQVNTELSRTATAQISLGETDVRTLAGVPSGAISMDNLRGKSAVSISITNQLIQGNGTSSAGAWYFLLPNGEVQGSTQFNGIIPYFIENWITPASQSSNYEALVTIVYGSLSGGTTGSWISLAANRSWYISTTTLGQTTCQFTVQIRRTGTTTVLDTATIDLEADVSD